ncbi:MAG: hypothetical protein KAS32_05440 [Candidatus Peribacteraceae bacterium]|nr:hypothetical protein [Candidatus Peribacteraceae bacterium]
MAKTKVKNLKIVQGSHYEHEFFYTDSSGDAIPLTGYSARCQFRAAIEEATPFFDVTDSDPELSINEAAGKVTLIVLAATSAAFTNYKGVHDIEIESPAGIPTRIVKGKVDIDREVTR